MNSEESELAKVIGKLLKIKGFSLSIAESVTGGKVGDIITGVPGSSDYFEGGVIAYSNRVKIELLKVPSETIQRYGAVSIETARCMASGVKELLKTDVGLATTGIAGPQGGSIKKPVGMVVFGIDIKGKITTNIEYFNPPRERVKNDAAVFLLKRLKDSLEK
ncbi:CinA family protein [candidate division WOR-3 bacterium]|nr:CinA family protein [candidate division WOR-3 bacterium]MCK4527934.1 CinA family protein [candidate division WOR-3 bacterium]